MELKWLETFTSVVREGSMSAAADQLGYSRSTVTHHVQNLEREFGAQLFDRQRGGILTQAGDVLMEHAPEVLRRVTLARNLTTRVGQQAVRLGATESVSIYRVPSMLQLLHRVLPQLGVAVEVGSTAEIIDRLRQGGIDLALIASTGDPVDLPSRDLCEEEIALIAPEGQSGRLSHRILLPQRGCVYREIIESEYLPQTPSAQIVQMGSLETVKSGVLAGLGTGLLPVVAVRHMLARGQVTRLPWTPSTRVTARLAWNPRTCPQDVTVHLERMGQRHLAVH